MMQEIGNLNSQLQKRRNDISVLRYRLATVQEENDNLKDYRTLRRRWLQNLHARTFDYFHSLHFRSRMPLEL
jgi:regulator of replication initiation timing